MHLELQPHLENNLVKLIPLKKKDFEKLYQVASDPLIWEQHPDKDRYKKEVFEKFFKGALESGGAFLILDQNSGEVIGSSRYYNYDEEKNITIRGYTFLLYRCCGNPDNGVWKNMMLDHAFK